MTYDAGFISLFRNNTYIDGRDDIAGDYSATGFRYGGDGSSGKVTGTLGALKVYYKSLSIISGALTQNYNAVSGQYV